MVRLFAGSLHAPFMTPNRPGDVVGSFGPAPSRCSLSIVEKKYSRLMPALTGVTAASVFQHVLLDQSGRRKSKRPPIQKQPLVSARRPTIAKTLVACPARSGLA